MASEPPVHPPGIGTFRPQKRADPFAPADHMAGFNKAIDNALANFGRAPGSYHANLVLSATVDVKNPGYVVEYIAKFI